MGTGGDVFLLDMGEPVKIVDLARQMIRLSGFRAIDENGIGDIEIQFTGLRPGEKLYEELLIDAENVEKTDHERILKSFESYTEFDDIKSVYIDLIKLCEYDNQQGKQIVLQGILKRYVAGYSNGW